MLSNNEHNISMLSNLGLIVEQIQYQYSLAKMSKGIAMTVPISLFYGRFKSHCSSLFFL